MCKNLSVKLISYEANYKKIIFGKISGKHMLHENVLVPYKNVETIPRIRPSKIIGTTKVYSSGQVSNSDDVIDFHIN